MLASSPGHSQILPRSSGEKKKKTTFLHSCEKKIMKWPGNEDIVKWLTPSDLVIISLLSSPSATRFSPEGCDRYASNVTYMHACMEQISAMAIQGNLSVCTKQNKQTSHPPCRCYVDSITRTGKCQPRSRPLPFYLLFAFTLHRSRRPALFRSCVLYTNERSRGPHGNKAR